MTRARINDGDDNNAVIIMICLLQSLTTITNYKL